MLATMLGRPSRPATAPILPVFDIRAASTPTTYAYCSLATSSEITLACPPEPEPTRKVVFSNSGPTRCAAERKRPE